MRRDGGVFQMLAENLDVDWSTSPRLEFIASGGLLVDSDVEYTAGRGRVPVGARQRDL